MLDWSAGPQINFSYCSLGDVLNVPTTGILYLLGLIIPAWLVQKLILVSMVFAMFYLPLKFFPFVRRNGNEYFASILFVFNPFVYERFLAGQWRVILGYVLLWPFFYFLISYFKKSEKKTILGAVFWLVLNGMFSVHGLAIGLVVGFIAFCVFLFHLMRGKDVKKNYSFAGDFLFGMGIFLVASSYWLVPFFTHDVNTLDDFDKTHQTAFATTGDPFIGVIGNVFTLRGFWGESHSWANSFISPTAMPFLFYLCFFSIATLCFFGARELLRKKKTRLVSKFLLLVFSFSMIFSAGISAYGVCGINQWLFDHVGFWSGFRDTQKWSGVTALIFALLGSVGVGVFTGKFVAKKKLQRFVLFTCLLLPIVFTPFMLGGFHGQLRSVWYPASWHKTNEFLRASEDECKAVFLPWHQYYSLDFNRGFLVANPATRFFDCEIISGHNTELGEIQDIPGDVEGYSEVEQVITSNSTEAGKIFLAIKTLKEHGVKYIIKTDDLEGSDQYLYPFLSSSKIHVAHAESGIVVYEIEK